MIEVKLKSTHMKDYRKRKREQGICTYGGCWIETGMTYCERHRVVTNNAQSRLHRHYRRRIALERPLRGCKATDCAAFVQQPAVKYCMTHSNTTTYFVTRLRGQVLQGLCHQGSCPNVPVEGITLCKQHHNISLRKNRMASTKTRDRVRDQRLKLAAYRRCETLLRPHSTI
jgi:hypothetical protein